MLGNLLQGFWRTLGRRRAIALLGRAQAAAAAGDREGAIDGAEKALERFPDMQEARILLGSLHLDGRSYDALLADIHALLKPRGYVEIGVATGKSLALVRPETRALGVDPDPAIQVTLPAGVRVFRETSDEFFARHDVRAELGGLPVDLAFIDGLHLFDQALRDFMHLEAVCDPGATILVHDCFPLDRVSAQRERKSSFWSGDVWKLVVLLRKYRPDLGVHVVAAPPSGLALIRGLDPGSRVLADRYDALVAEFLPLDYGTLRQGRADKLNVIANEWDGIRGLLGR